MEDWVLYLNCFRYNLVASIEAIGNVAKQRSQRECSEAKPQCNGGLGEWLKPTVY